MSPGSTCCNVFHCLCLVQSFRFFESSSFQLVKLNQSQLLDTFSHWEIFQFSRLPVASYGLRNPLASEHVGVLFSWILHWLPALWPSHFIVLSGKQFPSPPWPFKSIFAWSHTNPSFWNVWNIWCILCQELLACITTVITTNTRRITSKKGRQKREEKPEMKKKERKKERMVEG